MAIWSRFDEIVHEVNGLESPTVVRLRELQKILTNELKPHWTQLYRSFNEQKFQTEIHYMSVELWNKIWKDPNFNEGK